jgi:type I restriction enzyme, S subunit
MQRYNSYKPSGIDWLGDIPNHWRITRIIDRTLNRIGGDWGEDADSEEEDHVLLPVIRVQDIVDEYKIGITNLTYRKIKNTKIEHRLITNQSLLIEKSGGGEKQLVGRVAIPDSIQKDAICSNFMERFELDPKVDRGFINYIFHDLYSQNLNFPFVQQTTGIQNLNSTYYFYTKVAYPDRKEQIQIREFLDTATQNIDKVIALKQQQLQSLEQYKKSRIQEVITKGLDDSVPMKESGIDWIGKIPAHWKVERLKMLLDKINSGVTPKGGSTVYQDTGVPLIRSQNILDDKLDFTDIACISQMIHDNMSNSKVLKGDVFLNITGASLGRCHYYDLEKEANVNQHVCILRPGNKITTKYLYYLIYSEVGQSQISQGFKGSGREGLNYEAIKIFKIPLPKKKEQYKISEYLDFFVENLSKEKEIIETQITSLQQYRKSLIHECVTGKRKVIND